MAGALSLGVSCTRQTHSLGYNQQPPPNVVDASDGTTPTEETTSTEGTEPVESSSGGGETDAQPPLETTSEPVVDSGTADADAGEPDPSPVLLIPPNQFVDVLGLDPVLVDARINDVFEQLFFGNPTEQSVYVEVEEGSAYIYDVLHDDTRLDAMGYGMMTAVQLDRRTEFDNLWSYAQERFLYKDGPRAGYYRFTCSVDEDTCGELIDTFGVFYVATALFIAEKRWGDSEGAGPYGIAAREILDALQSKEEQNGGVVDGVLNVFGTSYLPRVIPVEGAPLTHSPGAVLPAFFELWSIATGDTFWGRAAERGRSFLLAVADSQTGLTPTLVDDNLQPAGSFSDESYGTAFMLALDYSWVGPRPEYVQQVDRLLSFFVQQGLPTYPALYELDGTPLNDTVSAALVALNGAAAGITELPERTAFIRAVWEAPTPTGRYRFYDGMNYLLSMLYLSGGLRGYY